MVIWPKAVALLLVPPGLLVVIGLLGFLIQIRWRWLGNIMVGLSIAALLLLSLPLTGLQLMAGLEAHSKPLPPQHTNEAHLQAEAIVVLGSGRYANAPEYGEDTIKVSTLERLRYAVYLHRQTRLPMLVSGGSPYGEQPAEAVLMQTVLERAFKVEPKWMESQSRNTYENAQHTRTILQHAGIRRIYLVTHARHMQRARWAFERVGFEVIAAPMGFSTAGREDRGVLGYLPSSKGLYYSSQALRERLGLLWYRLRYSADRPRVIEQVVAPAPIN